MTTRYPTEVDGWAAQLPTPPAFRPALLTHSLADRLIGICPTGALSLDDSHLVIDLGACSGCRRCLDVAGEVASPSGAWELATRDRATLIKRVAIQGGGE